MRSARDLVARELAGLGFDVDIPAPSQATILARRTREQIEVQVRSVRRRSDPAYWPKRRFQPRSNLYAALVIARANEPVRTYLIPSQTWLGAGPPFVSRSYEDAVSSPEWGINVSDRALAALERYRLASVAARL
jgi:hypothetical protein